MPTSPRRVPPHCALKVDRKKAFDLVEWSFLGAVLVAFGFPTWLTNRVMACVSFARLSISLNGELVGYFPSSKGLRQGDPLSLLVFVIAMEVFIGMMKINTMDPSFKFHWRCKTMGLTHLCFVENILIFSTVEVESVRLIMDTLNGSSQLSIL